MPPSDSSTYYRKGFGLKAEVQDTLAADYTGRLVDLLRARAFTLGAGPVTIRLAREFGFCYGVERAVEYAYQTRAKFPDRRISLAGEIIHNPHVNTKLRDMGIVFLSRGETGFDYAHVRADDVVILPAFGVTIADFETLREIGCVVVDTTCGSVLNVWKRGEHYAKDGFPSLIHRQYYHQETRATASQVERYPGGTYLVVRDLAQARDVCEYIEGKGLSREAFLEKYRAQASPQFDPAVHLRRIGGANQTTMLARGAPAVGEGGGGGGVPGGNLPPVRHDRQRDAGPAGRGERTAPRAARRDARARRLQLEQHDLPRRPLGGGGAAVPRGRRALRGPGARRDPAPAAGRAGGGRDGGMARRDGARARRAHRRREHAEQQDRRGRGARARHARRRSREHPLSALGYAALHGGGASAVLIPALGGKIRDVTLAGRQWFWHNADIPVARPARGDSYALAGDSGGLDECFPTIAACRVPAWVRGAGDLELPDHR